VVGEAVKSATLRSDIQCQVLSFLSEARNFLTLGRTESFFKKLDDIGSFFGGTSGYVMDVCSELCYHSLMAVGHLYREDYELAYYTAEDCQKLIRNSHPTNIFTVTGYSLVPLIYCYILKKWNGDHELSKIKCTMKKFIQVVKGSLANLRKFSQIFPFAKPSYYHWKGVFNFHIGNTSKAEISIENSLKAATLYDMKYDQALAHWRMGEFFKKEDHTQAASEIFKQLKVDYSALCL